VGSQLYTFLIYVLSGVLIGIFFDIFRVFRKSFKTPDFVTYLQDIFFWLVTGTFLLYVIFKFSNGEIRSYIFLGLGLGVLLYILIFSKHFIKINVFIIKILKTIIYKIIVIITYPLKLIFNVLRKVLFKPIFILSINIKKRIQILSKYDIIMRKMAEKPQKFFKKAIKKKDFR